VRDLIALGEVLGSRCDRGLEGAGGQTTRWCRRLCHGSVCAYERPACCGRRHTSGPQYVHLVTNPALRGPAGRLYPARLCPTPASQESTDRPDARRGRADLGRAPGRRKPRRPGAAHRPGLTSASACA
jgi:hypothetical protein